jgi:hypothetical protein
VSEPPDLRVSDADRELVAERLREAAGEGRLTIEELDERVDRAYEARTAGELAVLTEDLPEPRRSTALATDRPAGGRVRRWVIAIIGGGDLRGRWRAGSRLKAFALIGGGEIDLTHATLEEGELTITAVTVIGGFSVTVPPGWDAELTGFAVIGGNGSSIPPHEPAPGAPRVHVRAFTLIGGTGMSLPREERRRLRAERRELREAARDEARRLRDSVRDSARDQRPGDRPEP